MKKELLRINNGRLSNGLYECLDGVSLNLLAGEALGIIFANLHEKEALLKVLRADASFSSGRMYVNERTVSSGADIRQNIYVINKQPTLSDRLSICENLYFTKLPKFMLGLQIYREMLEDLLEQFHIDADLDSSIGSLNHRQLISLELVKAYVLKKKIIVLADLTSYLTPDEMNGVLSIVEQLKREGFGFILIESFWDMVFKHTDDIAIIKYGKTTGLYRCSGMGADMLRDALWQDLAPTGMERPAPKHFVVPEDEAMVWRDVQTAVLQNVSFALSKGKLMKLLYLDEKSRVHLLALLRGQRRPDSGQITLRRKPFLPSNEREALRLGMGVVEDNPQEKTLFRNMSVFDNLAFLLSGRMKCLWLDGRYQRNLRKTMRELCGEDMWDVPMDRLTPVQLQKLIYCKWLLLHPAVLVCINPFTGMDLQVDKVTENMLEKVCDRGTAVLMLASYLPENELAGELYYLEDGRLLSKGERG